MERVLGTPALFATVYGNVGSSIYYALGLTAVVRARADAARFRRRRHRSSLRRPLTYAEGTVRFPEAGGSASFSRHAFDEVLSFTAGWAQMLNYVITVAVSAFFVPHYLSIFWEPLRTNPWDIVVGAIVIVFLVALNVVGVQEAARRHISLAVIDFSTQVLLVIIGFALVFSPEVAGRRTSLGSCADAGRTSRSRSPSRCSRTRGWRPSRTSRRRPAIRSAPSRTRTSSSAVAVFAIYFTLPLVALSALPVERVGGELDDAARAPARGGRLRERPDPRRGREHRPRGAPARRGRDLRRRYSPRRSSSSRRTPASSARRASRTRWRATASCRRLCGACIRA